MKQGGEKAYSDDQVKNIVNTHTHTHKIHRRVGTQNRGNLPESRSK